MINPNFYQSGPELKNSFLSDPLLEKYILHKLPKEFQKSSQQNLLRLGELAASEWLALSQQAEKNPPQLIQYDSWGQRIDMIELSQGWLELEKVAAREGIVAQAYERKQGEYSRLVQMLSLYLFHPSSAFVSCPLAMTDGAARCLEVLAPDQVKQKPLSRLTSRDPNTFWTSGQWMTERTGGSDVSGTSTIAKIENGQYKLFGTKWFTSSTHSQMTMALAKIEPTDELSLFYLETRREDGSLNNIEVHRLKDKLGTKALPTAELTLKGTPATLIGNPGQGVKNIATILNITRSYNAVCATSHLRRGLDLLKSYSEKRVAFGKSIHDHVLHRQLLAELESDWQKCFYFTFHMAHLLGKEEVGSLTQIEKIELRCMTPILKLYTAKLCARGLVEIGEAFGGAGYVEDTGIPTLVRDSLVFSIWEGTTSVLTLDFLRALNKEPGAYDWLQENFASELLKQGFKLTKENIESEGRRLVFALAELYIEKIKS